MSLTPKQKRFAAEYLTDLNATQAALRAGYSPRTARVIGGENLLKPAIAAAIAAGMKRMEERTEVTQERVIAELARVAFSDLRRVMGPDGSLRKPQEWDHDTAGAIASMECVTRGPEEAVEYVHKVKAWDKMAALEKLGRHVGLWKDDKAPGDLVGRLLIYPAESETDAGE